jgi:acyl carrier protein
MKKSDFLRRLEAELGRPAGSMTEATVLAELKGWDSMGKMAVLTLIDGELGVAVPQGALQQCATSGDLVRLAGSALSDSNP